MFQLTLVNEFPYKPNRAPEFPCRCGDIEHICIFVFVIFCHICALLLYEFHLSAICCISLPFAQVLRIISKIRKLCAIKKVGDKFLFNLSPYDILLFINITVFGISLFYNLLFLWLRILDFFEHLKLAYLCHTRF